MQNQSFSISRFKIARGKKEVLRNLFGNNVKVKVLDFLLLNRTMDHTKEEISKGVKVSRSQIHRIWPSLTDLGLVVETRRIGPAKLYKVNMQSPISKKLESLSLEIENQTTKDMQSLDKP